MNQPRWLAEHAVVQIHQMLLSEHGGPDDVRDSAVLQSALDRAKNKLSYEPGSSVFDLAAACCFGVARNHPFVDGNKRTAFVCGALFLEVNGYTLRASEADAVVAMESLAAGLLDEADLTGWFQEHSDAAKI